MMRRLQLKELEKLGPKMKGIGEIWLFFHGIVPFFSHEGFYVPSLTIRQGSLAVARRR
jgi:hypothetical protein